jgi:dienelactone hydrolase
VRVSVVVLVANVLLTAAADRTNEQTRADFLKLIDRPRVGLAPEVQSARGHQRFSFASEAGERVPGILVSSSSRGPHPAVIVLHGTGDRKESMAPLLDALAARGFVAVAIDGRFHGQRSQQPSDYEAAILRTYRTGEGHPFLYDTVWDVMRLVDYLQTRADVDGSRIGLMGISKGGMETYLTAAVDPRIRAAVPVIGVQSFRWVLDHDAWRARVETILDAITGAARGEHLFSIDAPFVRKFYDRVAPGIYGEFDGPAMLPLIAPRPLLVINGDSDERTPLAGVREAASAAQRAYAGEGVKDRFRLLIQPDAGHEFTPAAQRIALEWFVTWLKP